jgi:PAS domain S-box-containing protein
MVTVGLTTASSRFKGLGRTLCLAGAAVGALGVVLWILRIERILTVFPGVPPMMPNSAFALLLLGIASDTVLRGRAGTLQKYIVLGLATAVTIISLGTIAEYALTSNFFLDDFLQPQKGIYHAAASSPPAALALALLGAGALSFNWRSGNGFRPAEWFILSTALIAITALLGYLYGASEAYRLTGPPIAGIGLDSARLIRVAGDVLIVGVSFLTALSLLLISIGLYLGRSDWQTMSIVAKPGPGGLLMRRLVPVAVLVPVGFGVIASRFPGTGDNPLVLAGLTDGTGMLGLLLLGATGRHLNRGNDALEHARKQAHDLIELASDGIFIADLEGRLTEVNETACRLVGYGRGELLGKVVSDLISPAEAERFRKHKVYLLEGHDEVSEWVGVKKDGSTFPIEVSAKILPDQRWLTIVRDITVRKRTEDALRLSEATARRATKARDELLGIVAHDLRNPLHIVAMDANALRSCEELKVRDIGKELSMVCQRMDRLIKDLLDLTRIDAGLFSVKRARVPLRELIEDTIQSEKLLALSARVELETVLSAHVPDIWADHDRVIQVLDNLIGNAIKFTDSGGTIVLTVESGMGEAIFSVSDTGKGIAEADLPHIFDRFWRASETERRGAGLGLAIVKGIVEAHNGRVWVESSPGQGSRFFFTIPFAPQSALALPGRSYPLINRDPEIAPA